MFADLGQCSHLLKLLEYNKLEEVSQALESKCDDDSDNEDAVPFSSGRHIEYSVLLSFMPYTIRDMTLQSVYLPWPETV